MKIEDLRIGKSVWSEDTNEWETLSLIDGIGFTVMFVGRQNRYDLSNVSKSPPKKKVKKLLNHLANLSLSPYDTPDHKIRVEFDHTIWDQIMFVEVEIEE